MKLILISLRGNLADQKTSPKERVRDNDINIMGAVPIISGWSDQPIRPQ